MTTTLPQLRHLDYGPDASIEEVGAAGLQAILDGYDVEAWQPILLAVQRDPWGPVAHRLERIVDHLESYGTREAMGRWLRRCRAGTDAPVQTLAQLRRGAGLTQRELAERLGVSQAQVARLESAALPTLRSLTRYLSALDARPVAILAVCATGPTVIPVRTWSVRQDPAGRCADGSYLHRADAATGRMTP